MKKTRLLTLLLAASMMLSLFPMTALAASDYNYIRIEEEVIVENGNFDETPDVSYNSNKNYKNLTEGAWWYRTNTDGSASHKYVTEADNSYLQFVADDALVTAAYRVGKLDAGSYTLSFDIKADFEAGTMSYFTLRVFELDDSFTVAGNGAADGRLIVCSYGDDDRENWKTFTYTLELDEDADVAFDFFTRKSNGDAIIDGTICVDNVSITRAQPLAIETAVYDSVDNSKTYPFNDNKIDPALPKATWVSTNNTYRTLVGGKDALNVKRIQSTLIADTPTVFYTFEENLGAGRYKLSFDVITANAKKGTVQVLDITGSWTKVEGQVVDITDINGTKHCTVDFTLTSERAIAFRYYPGNLPSNPFSIDNVKLEIYDKTVVFLDEDYENTTLNKSIGDYGVARTDLGKVAVNSSAEGNDEIDKLEIATCARGGDTDNKAIHYKAKKGTPSLAIGLGKLPRGKYTVTFDVYMEEGFTGLKRNAHYYINGKREDQTFDCANMTVTAGQWHNDVTFTFEVTDDNAYERLVRIWPGTAASEFYLDNLKVVATDVYDIGVVDTEDVANIQDGKGNYRSVTDGYWRNRDSGEIKNVTFDGRTCVRFKTAKTDTFIRAFDGDLIKGNYTLSLKYYPQDSDRTTDLSTRFQLLDVSTSTDAELWNVWGNYTPNTWNTISATFTVANDNTDAIMRFYPNDANTPPDYLYIDEFTLTGPVLREWREIYSNDFSTAPKYNNTNAVNFENGKNNRDTWCKPYDGFAAGELGYENEMLTVKPYTNVYYDNPHTSVMYRFDNTLSKGDYVLELVLGAYITDYENYKVAIYDTAGNFKKELTTPNIAAGNERIISLAFSVDSDMDAVLTITPANSRKYTGEIKVSDVTIYKLSSPVVGLTSNADLATFDSDDGVYYLAVNAEKDVYVNYCNFESLRPGNYILSGQFKTAADDVTVDAAVGPILVGSADLYAGEWTDVEFAVKLPREIDLSISSGVRFETNCTAPLYMKDMKLVFVEDLPKPALNSSIAMILLKKIAGTYPSFASTLPVEYVVNGGFDEEVAFTYDKSRGYHKHEDGKWTYSRPSGTVDAKIVKDGDNSYAYFEVANSNPTVGYRVGTLPAGKYTLSFDIYPEYDIGSIRTRVFNLADDFAVTKTEYTILDKTSPITVGKNNTLVMDFVLTEETPIAIGFYARKENPCPEVGNFRLDNFSLIGRP